MTETVHLNLPLLSPSQAQKHVTVNEALTRLDGLVQLRLASITETVPPVAVDDGTAYGVPVGAQNDWAGQEGQIALFVNGGWAFVPPQVGFRAVILDQGVVAMHDGQDWRAGAVTRSGSGAGMRLISDEVEVAVPSGASVASLDLIPERAIVFGVTGLVKQAIQGPSSWRLGVAADPVRYGSGLGVGVNSWVSGPSTPLVYWSAESLLLSADGGDFAGGAVRLVAHYALLDIPNWV